MRYRNLSDTPLNRRRSRSQLAGKDDASTYDDTTQDGLMAQHRITKREVADLQRKWREDVKGNGYVAVIDAGDGAVLTGYSKQFHINTAGSFSEVTATLSAAGTTDTVANVIINGYVVETITIPADELSATVSLGRAVAAGDNWQVQQTQAGTGAVGPTYFGVFV